jgi:hypothetical protein
MGYDDKLISVHRYGERGWEWTVDRDMFGRRDERRYRTDGNGEGLWEWGAFAGSGSPAWRQIAGHLQYSIRASSVDEAIRLISRRWDLPYEPR